MNLSVPSGRDVLQTCYVPQLEPDHSVIVPLQHLQGEVHPDGGPVVLGEDLVDVPLDDGRLPDSQVPDDQNFEQELLLHGCSSAQMWKLLRRLVETE